MVVRVGLIIGTFAAFPSGAVEPCLSGLGPNWEDLEAAESSPVSRILEILEKDGKKGTGGKEKWYEDEEGRVVYCVHSSSAWTSFLFDFVDGEWKIVNEVRTVLLGDGKRRSSVVSSLEEGFLKTLVMELTSNYAIKPTPEQALGANRTMPPARLIAALAITW